MILNLIVNAIEAMSGVSEGARELSISTEINASNDALVAVRDSGPGLDPTSLEHLFDAFYTTKSSGMGMGLSICRSIIEAHKGRIWAEANVPQGATFQFTPSLGRPRRDSVPVKHRTGCEDWNRRLTPAVGPARRVPKALRREKVQ